MVFVELFFDYEKYTGGAVALKPSATDLSVYCGFFTISICLNCGASV
jgi:hypothetical protein